MTEIDRPPLPGLRPNCQDYLGPLRYNTGQQLLEIECIIEGRWLGRGRISKVKGKKMGEALERFSILAKGNVNMTSPIPFWCGAV